MTDFSLRVGIDISAQQVSATWGTTPEEHRPVVEAAQSPQGYQQLIHQLHQTGHDPAHCQVIMEATGTYWMRLAYTLHAAGFSVSVVNPVQAHRLAQAQLRRAKTDAIDAHLLMELGFKLEPLPWTPPPPLYDALYQRLRQRDALLEIRTQERNRLHALHQWPDAQTGVIERYHLHIAFLTEQIDALQAEIEQLLHSDSAWSSAAHSLLSIPGIGPITAAWLMVASLNFTTCQTVEELVAFAGLAPYPQQSGTSLHRTRGVGHGGHVRLRSALYMAALAAVHSNSMIRRFYARLRQRGKPAKVALCACARKLVLLAWALVTKHQVFDPDFEDTDPMPCLTKITVSMGHTLPHAFRADGSFIFTLDDAISSLVNQLYSGLPLAASPQSQATPKQIKRNDEIRAKYKAGNRVPDLAREYGISTKRVYQLLGWKRK